MEFFEFFFSGPDWYWRVFGLICLIFSMGYVLTNLFELFVTYLLCRKAIKEGIDVDTDTFTTQRTLSFKDEQSNDTNDMLS